jgi:hypothetical protein
MHRRIVTIAMAVLFSAAVSTRMHAAPAPFFHRHHDAAKPTSSKVVRFNIRNATSGDLVLKAGDQQYTIAPGKSSEMKLPDGTDVVAVNGTPHEAAGTVVTKVSSVLQNNTLVIN